MAIISGGRINIWNAVKKQFEVVHPETEVARITDFADGIVQKLALTSAMAAITELQKDSWFGKLLKMALTASGVKYSIAENGYVCLGDLFGGLIIQWGNVKKVVEGTGASVTFALTFKTGVLYAACTLRESIKPSYANVVSKLTNKSMTIGASGSTSGSFWLCIGY